MELLRQIEVPLYIRRVKLSDRRKPTYYELGRKIKVPKKYLDKRKYDYKPWKYTSGYKMILTDLATKKRVIKNSKSMDKPRIQVINGQDIYNQNIVQESRNKLLKAIKDFFVPFIEEQMEPLDLSDLPVRIECEVHYPYLAEGNSMPWDMDNHFWLYQKGFQDVLQGYKGKDKQPTCRVMIPEDNTLCISKPPSPLHIPVDTYEERKIVFFIYKEWDERILNYHKRQELFNKHIVEQHGTTSTI
jgi:hypothetical protein